MTPLTKELPLPLGKPISLKPTAWGTMPRKLPWQPDFEIKQPRFKEDGY
jgi:hypothetical protein